MLLLTLLVLSELGFAQGPHLVLENYETHSGMVGTSDLTGHKTWRLYLELTNPNDRAFAVYTTPEMGIGISQGSEYDFFQFESGGFFAEDLNCTDTLDHPEAQYDSYFTIGKRFACDIGEPLIDTIFNPDWEAVQSDFQNGMNVGISLGHWKIETDDPAGIPDGSNRILLGQFTTQDDIQIFLNIEILINGDPESSYYLENQIIYSGPLGCTNTEADNYNSEALADDGSCIFSGCTDYAGCNYDSQANLNDGSCDYSCYGCMNSLACNFDSVATMDLENCILPGCMDSLACNYDPETSCNDGIACTYPGCTDTTAYNYNSSAACDDGSCTYCGCMDSLAINYDSSAVCEDGSCIYPCITDSLIVNWECIWNEDSEEFDTGFNIYSTWEGDCVINEICFTSSSPPLQYCINTEEEEIEIESGVNAYIAVPWIIPGTIEVLVTTDLGFSQTILLEVYNCIGGCTDPFADNYNSWANVNDGSCLYEPCASNDVILHIETEVFAPEISWQIIDENGNSLLSSPPYLNESTYIDTLCLEDGCYSFLMQDDYGDGWNGAFYELRHLGTSISAGTLQAGYTAFDFFSVNDECPLGGCTDPMACNYDSLATVDNGTCIYSNDPCDGSGPPDPELTGLIGSFNQVVNGPFELPLQNINLERKVEIHMYSYTGLEHMHKVFIFPVEQIKIPINTHGLSKGIYWIKVINGSQKEVVNIGLY